MLGTIINTWYDPAPVPGNNVEVSLDLACQVAGEDEMARLFSELAAGEGDGNDVEGGALVAIDVKTGQILAWKSRETVASATILSSLLTNIPDRRLQIYRRSRKMTFHIEARLSEQWLSGFTAVDRHDRQHIPDTSSHNEIR